MVEINNQRKAFLDMLAWSEGTDNGRWKPKLQLWRHCRRRAIYWLLRSPSQTCHAKPKTQINRRRTLPASSCWWDAYRKKLNSLKDFSPKSQDAVKKHCSRLRSVALYLWLIVISVRQSTVAAISGLHCRAITSVRRIRLTAWIAKFKEAGGTVREIDVWAESPRLSPLWVICIIACHGLLIITVITPLPTKPSATKMPENWSWRTRQLLTCSCISVMLLRSMQNTRRSMMPKLKMMSV